MRILNCFTIVIFSFVFFSCERNSGEGENTLAEKLSGHWTLLQENGDTAQHNSNTTDYSSYNCGQNFVFEVTIDIVTVWEFEIDGDFEEKYYYFIHEIDEYNTNVECQPIYEYNTRTEEFAGSWNSIMNDSIEISHTDVYSTIIDNNYSIISLSSDELILESDDADKKTFYFKKRG